MSARWTYDAETLFMLHAHNVWSNYKSELLDRAEALGIPVKRVPCQSADYSWAVKYIVPVGCAGKIRRTLTFSE
jgi:hypothetical protein